MTPATMSETDRLVCLKRQGAFPGLIAVGIHLLSSDGFLRPVAEVGCAGPLARNHGSSQGVFRGTASSESRALNRLDDSLKDFSALAFRFSRWHWIFGFKIMLEFSKSIEIPESIPEPQTARGYRAKSPPGSGRDFEDFTDHVSGFAVSW